jgi:catechol 2,3-dioxygenase-like lactoylglutathione lyase family enzyme
MTQQAPERNAPNVPFEYDDALVISVGVSNLEEAIQWYRDLLGFELVYKLDEYGWCEVQSPLTGVSVGLGQSESPKVTGAVPTWTVKDIQAARAHLESNGVRFDGDTHEIEGMVKLATFYDPDGNPWMLAERLQQEYRTS